jgi:hypothetical protein
MSCSIRNIVRPSARSRNSRPTRCCFSVWFNLQHELTAEHAASFVDLDYRELGSVYRNGTRLCIWPGHLRDEAEPDRLCGKCRKRKGGRADEGSKAN